MYEQFLLVWHKVIQTTENLEEIHGRIANYSDNIKKNIHAPNETFFGAIYCTIKYLEKEKTVIMAHLNEWQRNVAHSVLTNENRMIGSYDELINSGIYQQIRAWKNEKILLRLGGQHFLDTLDQIQV